MAMLVVALAARGPDEDHPYGHDKFETMGAVAIVGFLSISCFELLRGAVVRLLESASPTSPGNTEVALLAATGIVNVAVVAYERRQARRLGSQLLMADAAPVVRSRTNATGTVFAEVTIIVDGGSSVEAAHRIANAVELSVSGALGGSADVMVHIEPS